MTRKLQLAVKRIFDICVSLVVLVPFLPVWVVIALLVKLTSPGPVFFLQDRPGKDKKIFKVYKFRTMRPGSEKMVKGVEVMKDDDRVTAVGHFLRRSKLDEIPQCLNVLKGEMSLIGPRPERVSSLDDYDEEISKRLNMLPGTVNTGLSYSIARFTVASEPLLFLACITQSPSDAAAISRFLCIKFTP